MSTLRITTLATQDGTYSVPSETLSRAACRAWVNFNGTGTVAIRASYNVSSITDNNPGDYTVNFTNALPDINFSATATPGGTPSVLLVRGVEDVSARTTTSWRFVTATTTTATDATWINIAIFR